MRRLDFLVVGSFVLLVALAGVGCGSDESSSTSSGGSGGATGGAGGAGGGNGGAGGNGGGTVEGWPPSATVYFDERGVLAADCATDADCIKVLGYYHAFNRFVQMEFRRRLTTGRLSALLPKLLAPLVGVTDFDADQRQLFSTRDGVPIEEYFLEQVSPELLAILEAYAVGVNQWIRDVQTGANGAKFPRELTNGLLDYGPEDIPDWTPQDTISVSMLLFEQLSNSYSAIVRTGESRARIDDDTLFSDLYARRPIKESSILEAGTFPPPAMPLAVPKSLQRWASSRPLDAGPALRALREKLDKADRLGPIFGQGEIGKAIGSNNWIVSPSNTTAGNALLSNDPHLGLSNPPIWYTVTLDSKTNGTGTLRGAGHTAAGVPVVLIGQNEDIAWGVTTTNLALTDVYVEELVVDEQGAPTGVLFKGEEVPFLRKTFAIEFNDGTTEDRELLYVPHHGPVRALDAENGVALTLKWTVQDVSTDLEGYFGLLAATKVTEAQATLRKITTAAQNFVIADRDGNIGWFPYNRVPKRTWATNLDGGAAPWLPISGAGDYEWDEYFAIEELPQAINPTRGFLATANNDMTGALFDNDPTNEGPPFQVDAAAGYRHAQIVRLLEAGGNAHSAQTMLDIVANTHSFIGEEMTPAILAIANDETTTLSATAQKVVNALEAWDFECPTGLSGTNSEMSPFDTTPGALESASGCAAFHVALRELNSAITRDENAQGDPDVAAPEDTRVNYAAFYSIVDPDQLGAGDIYWDDIETPQVETRFDIMAMALETAGAFLEAELGADETEWAWGRLHGALLRSDLDELGIAQYNNPASGESAYANDGGLYTVDVANPNSDYQQTAGPSTRFVCEALPAGVSCSFQIPGGQSSDIDSPNYDDLLPDWLINAPSPLVLDIEEAKNNAARTVPLGQ